MRDWGEYVYQSDLTGELYEITTTAYNMVAYLLKHPEIQIPPELKPFIDEFREAIEPDLSRFTEEDE